MAIAPSIKRGAEHLNLSEKDVNRVLNWFFQEEIPYVLFELGESIEFRNCGTFKTIYQKAVRGRNFQSKESIMLAPRYRIVWRSREKYKRSIEDVEETRMKRSHEKNYGH